MSSCSAFTTMAQQPLQWFGSQPARGWDMEADGPWTLETVTALGLIQARWTDGRCGHRWAMHTRLRAFWWSQDAPVLLRLADKATVQHQPAVPSVQRCHRNLHFQHVCGNTRRHSLSCRSVTSVLSPNPSHSLCKDHLIQGGPWGWNQHNSAYQYSPYNTQQSPIGTARLKSRRGEEIHHLRRLLMP